MGVLDAVMVRSQRIADHIAGIVMGVVLASLLTGAMSWLWPGMGLPILIVFLGFWGLTTIDTIFLQRHNLVRTSSSGWKSVKSSELGDRLTPRESIWGDIATILLGAVVALFVAGLIGKLSLGSRWPVFLVVFLLWVIVVVSAITARRKK